MADGLGPESHRGRCRSGDAAAVFLLLMHVLKPNGGTLAKGLCEMTGLVI